MSRIVINSANLREEMTRYLRKMDADPDDVLHSQHLAIDLAQRLGASWANHSTRSEMQAALRMIKQELKDVQ